MSAQDGGSLLLNAVLRGDTDTITALIKAGANANAHIVRLPPPSATSTPCNRP